MKTILTAPAARAQNNGDAYHRGRNKLESCHSPEGRRDGVSRKAAKNLEKTIN